MTRARKSYPSDVSDNQWSLVVPYLTLVREDAPQRQHALRELFSALRYGVPGERCPTTTAITLVKQKFAAALRLVERAIVLKSGVLKSGVLTINGPRGELAKLEDL